MGKFSTLLALVFSLSSQASSHRSNEGLFSGRVSRVNDEAGLIRFKVDFNNSKYLNKKDKVEIWTELNPARRCKAYVAGKSPDYLLIKVSDYTFCQRFIPFNAGQYLLFYSDDLKNNLKMGRELYQILLKKRLALEGKMRRRKKELDSHMERSMPPTSAIRFWGRNLKQSGETRCLTWKKISPMPYAAIALCK